MSAKKTPGKIANRDEDVVAGFGDEWERFDQQALSDNDQAQIFSDYFRIFPWERLPLGAVGADIGCGSGRWAKTVEQRVMTLHCVDASAKALGVARQNLAGIENVAFHLASVDSLPFSDNSLDFAYSLGVLHHVPDTAAAINSIAAKLKPGAPFLVYLYYAFDNRPSWFRLLWKTSEGIRNTVSRLPFPLRYLASQVLALGVYWPLARVARVLEWRGCLPESWPLSYYRDKAFYVMRTDALNRFGTRLEQRFTREEIRQMLESAGLSDVHFSDHAPYWCAVGIKR